VRDDGVVAPPSPFDGAPAHEVNPDLVEGRAARVAVVLDVKARGACDAVVCREGVRAVVVDLKDHVAERVRRIRSVAAQCRRMSTWE